jgi:hypothetical protein
LENPVTSQPQPAPGEGRSAGQFLRPLRDLTAYALVGAVAVLLFVAVIRLIPDGAGQFSFRTQGSFYGFINLATISFPLGAVLLALLVQPRHPKAQLIVVAALAEYAVMAFFGVFFGVLIGLINQAGNDGARGAFEELLVRAAWLAVFGIAAFAVFQIWRGMFAVVRPKPQPGVYGQPPQYHPGAYPGQPGYAPAPGFPPPGATYPPQQPPPPGFGQPGPYGPPAQNPPWQPAVPTSGAAPYPAAPPGPYAPQPGNPQAAPHGGLADPPPVAPPQAPADDRTEKLGEDRPGFGPADQDPPRQ